MGVCGSIAAYKAAEVVRGLVRSGLEVRVCMTGSARAFVGPATFAATSGHPVLTDVFEDAERVPHVELGRWADVYVVCGATASTLARLAAGAAPDPVSATYLMCRCPVVVAPAMHTEMWEHPATRRNVERLAQDGVLFVGPEVGDLASGDVGPGRLADPERIVDAALAILAPRDLEGVRVLVTAGPTREPIDPVRFVSNRSTGRMGFALAAEAHRRGARVTVVAGPTSVPPPAGIEVVGVERAEEMLKACLERWEETDVAVLNAAVADWRPARAAARKLRKEDAPPVIELAPTPDIALELGRRKGGRTLVLFAAETHDVVEGARAKLSKKGADLVVANLVGTGGTGFESETNEAAIVTCEGAEELGRLSKDELARIIWDRIIPLVGSGDAPSPDR